MLLVPSEEGISEDPGVIADALVENFPRQSCLPHWDVTQIGILTTRGAPLPLFVPSHPRELDTDRRRTKLELTDTCWEIRTFAILAILVLSGSLMSQILL